MAGEQAPLAAVQAAVLKSAAGKAATENNPNPSGSTQASAVAQDLAVMADQARGYTEGVNQGVIVAQDQRAAQSRRLAAERAAADAERQRALALERAQTGLISTQGQAAAQADAAAYARQAAEQRIAASRRALEAGQGEPEPDKANAYGVVLHALQNQDPQFQDVFVTLTDQALSAKDVVGIFDNAKRNGEDWTEGIDRKTLYTYAQEYFRALQGEAIRTNRLEPEEKKGGNWVRALVRETAGAATQQARAGGGRSGSW